MGEMVLMMGLPGSGKSAYVDEILSSKYQVICGDDVRLALGYVFDERIESIVRGICETSCRAVMVRGRDVVIDETSTRIDGIKKWMRTADEFRYRFKCIFLDVDYKECCKRRRCSEGLFPIEVMERMQNNLDKTREKLEELLKKHTLVHIK